MTKHQSPTTKGNAMTPQLSTMNLTLREQRSHEAELLARIQAAGRRTTLAGLFKGCSPRWAEEALYRLEASGRVKEADDGSLELTGK